MRSYGPFIESSDSGHLMIDGCDTLDIAAEFGTPVWVVSERTIRHNYRSIQGAFTAVYRDTRIAYASKANPQPALLAIVRSEGALVDVVTMGHIRLALMAGFTPGQLIFNGNNKTTAELSWALENGVGMINIDSLAEAEALARLQPYGAAPQSVAIRLAHDTARHSEDDDEFAIAQASSKFGMDQEDALEAVDVVADHPALSLDGLHNHTGYTAYSTPYSADLDLKRHQRAAQQVLDTASLLSEDRGVQLKHINLGGGYRIGRPQGFGPQPTSDVPGVSDYADVIGGVVSRMVGKGHLGRPQLILEAGGYLVADSTVLLGSVGLTKTRRTDYGNTKWVFLDETSAYHFVRRLMFNFHHHIVAAGNSNTEPSETVSIGGPTCAADTIAAKAALPPLNHGDIVAILDQGAYCEAVSTEFCAVPIPATVLAADGEVSLIRPRESLPQLAARFTIPSRLGGEARDPRPALLDPTPGSHKPTG